jgi:HAD superfamily hydrolase (TIGR01509 family)
LVINIQAVVFDFDGLIFDSETPDYLSWKAVYESFGCELPLLIWQENIGSVDFFNPYTYLEGLLGRPIDRTAVHDQRKKLDKELLGQQTILPGVLDYLAEARQLGLKVGLASSSDHKWVDGYLEKLELVDRFDTVRCRDDVGDVGKPDPAVYLAALAALDVAGEQALALEDSPNGALAAKRAGMYCAIVPNEMTRGLTFGEVNYRLNSLADMSLAALLEEIGRLETGD